MTTIAFIGLGNMGIGMVGNLAKAGHDVRAFDLSKDAVQQAVALGCVGADNIAHAVAEAEIVVTMLPAGAHVKSVYCDAEGVLAHGKPGTLMIDSSTIDVTDARDVISVAKSKGFEMIDAPVSGGVGGAPSPASSGPGSETITRGATTKPKAEPRARCANSRPMCLLGAPKTVSDVANKKVGERRHTATFMTGQ